ncbi:MAG: DUF29 domain-containing protein [Candidatus Magnetoovum sp. WYHC-5]|nr:DUF29 domain-containing protein [Candidatus Magnetoovum sp. WYHC-5]
MNNQITITDSNTAKEKTLYETDFYQWALHNAELLRQGRLTEIDIDNIAEEIESMGRNNKKELTSRLIVLIMHLLKWQYQPKRRSRSWKLTISTQRSEIGLLFENSPSLKYDIETVIEKSFKNAKILFEDQTGISKQTLPEICPYIFEQLSDYEFWPE